MRTFSSTREEGSVQLTQRLSKASTVFYRYTYRRVSVDQATLKITPFLIPLLSQPVRVGIVSFGWIQDRRDDPVDPHKGIYNTVDIGLAEHLFGSQMQLPALPGAQRHLPPHRQEAGAGAQHRRSATSTPSTTTGDPLNAIPLPERFFGGGGTSHRGFPENQAGPRDPTTGFPLGGTALFFNQTELRFPLIGDNIGGVLFHDMGNIYSSAEPVSRCARRSAIYRISTTWCTRWASAYATGRRSARCAWTWPTASIRRTSSASRARSRI